VARWIAIDFAVDRRCRSLAARETLPFMKRGTHSLGRVIDHCIRHGENLMKGRMVIVKYKVDSTIGQIG
jgi:hypothetical protein